MLRPASRQRYTVARPQVTLMDSVTPAVRKFENKREDGSLAFSKVLLHKHNLPSERLGMEPLQSAVSWSQLEKIILKARFRTRSSYCLRYDCTLLLQTWLAYSKTDRTRAQCVGIR